MAIEVEYDHLAISAEEDPVPALNELRDRCPVAHTDAHGGFWVVSRYADVTAIARDYKRFTSQKGITIPHHGFPVTLCPIELDPPMHRTFRAPLTEYFSQSNVERKRPELEAAVDALLDEMIEDGRGDLATGLTIPYPAVYALELLNLPKEDTPKFLDWAVRIMSVSDPTVTQETIEYFMALYENRKANPQDDIPTLILNIDVDGREVTPIEFCTSMATLFTAGLDTTANGGAYALELIAKDPELRARLLADLEGTLPGAVEELLRFISPIPALSRTATEDVEIDGQQIKAGERVQLNWMAANRDPEQFEDPNTLDIDRKAKTQVAFGHGVHRCLGQHLARLEVSILIERVLTRMPDYQLDPELPVKRYPGVTRGINSLPVRFTPGARVAAS